ncbi:hypothetical protein EPN42_05605 [bacterium]|nr:MAG: hypothetical protein EPN42_05605 [bacterium]
MTVTAKLAVWISPLRRNTAGEIICDVARSRKERHEGIRCVLTTQDLRRLDRQAAAARMQAKITAAIADLSGTAK